MELICEPSGAAPAYDAEDEGKVSPLSGALCYDESTVTVKFIDPELETDDWLEFWVSKLFI